MLQSGVAEVTAIRFLIRVCIAVVILAGAIGYVSKLRTDVREVRR